MEDTSRPAVAGIFALGMVAGAALMWSLALAAERFRRVRHDLRTAKKGVKTLRVMLRRYLGDVIKLGLLVGLIAAAVVVAVTR